MSRGSTLILLGVITLITPFSGVPASFRTFAMVIVGALVFGMGASIRARDHKAAAPVAKAEQPLMPVETPMEQPVVPQAPTEISPM